MTWTFRVLGGIGLLAVAAVVITVLVDKIRVCKRGIMDNDDDNGDF